MPCPLWTGPEVKALTGACGLTEWSASGVSIDTRTLTPGDIFVAIQGPRFDGHQFAREALAKGASAVLSHQDLADPRVMRVDDTLQALRQLAQGARVRFQGKILALTGSVGKTTVKEGLKAALPRAYASYGSFNNDLGVALSLARMPMDAPYGVFELGMNHGGEIRSLVQRVQPHVAMITNVSYQHGAHFASLEEIVRAKAEILGAVEDKTGVLFSDGPHFADLKSLGQEQGLTQWVTFGTAEGSSIGAFTPSFFRTM